jgi:hypothetical protein
MHVDLTASIIIAMDDVMVVLTVMWPRRSRGNAR